MTKEEMEKILGFMRKDPAVRRRAVRESFLLFFAYYFRKYFEYGLAPFHYEIIDLLEDEGNALIAIVAFRYSAKSTLVTTAYAVWSIMGRHQRKFVVITSQTESQMRQHMQNIRDEIEQNEFLKKDLGPFREEQDESRAYSIVLSNCDARITGISIGQRARGLRHREHRPDVIIGDDLEDKDSVSTMENRDKTYRWFTEELAPTRADGGRIIAVGNFLHPDSLLMRLKREIQAGTLIGTFRRYPIITRENKIAWPARFPDMEAIEAFRKGQPGAEAWEREFLLEESSSDGRIVRPEWIRRYDALPAGQEHIFLDTLIAVDPAFTEGRNSSMSSIVVGRLYYRLPERDFLLFVLPDPVNERFSGGNDLKVRIQEIAKAHSAGNRKMPEILVEQVGAQIVLADWLTAEGFSAKGFPLNGMSKRERLAVAGMRIQSGNVLFPRQGVEKLIEQIVYFEPDGYNDLADALSLLVRAAFESGRYNGFYLEALRRQAEQKSRKDDGEQKPKPYGVSMHDVAGQINNPAWRFRNGWPL